MRTILLLLALFGLSKAEDDGQYRPGKYGDEGHYVPGDEGRYYHVGGNHGKFQSDNSLGLSGGFKSHAANRFGSAFKSSPVSSNQFLNRFVVEAAPAVNFVQNQPLQPASSFIRPPTFNQAPKSSFSKTSSFSSPTKDGQSRTLKHESELDLDSYHYAFETDNNIRAAADGRIEKLEGLKSTGFYEYLGPDNVLYRIDYIADKNGFQPIGKHIPTPPPIPEEIARILVDVGK